MVDKEKITTLWISLAGTLLVFTSEQSFAEDQVFRLDPITVDGTISPSDKPPVGAKETQDAKRASIKFWSDIESVIKDEQARWDEATAKTRDLVLSEYEAKKKDALLRTESELKQAIQLLLKQVNQGVGDQRTANAHFALAESYRQLESLSPKISEDSFYLVTKNYERAIELSTDLEWQVNPVLRLSGYLVESKRADQAFVLSESYFARVLSSSALVGSSENAVRLVELSLRTGDFSFDKGNIASARKYYELAMKIIEADERKIESEMLLEAHVRLAWVYFKMGLGDRATKHALAGLDSRLVHSSQRKADQLRMDLCEILAAVSFESGSQARANSVLTEGASRLYIDRFAVSLMRLLIKAGRFSDAVAFGDRFHELKKLHLNSPTIVFLTAYAEKKLTDDFSHLQRLQTLINFYGKSTAWNSEFGQGTVESRGIFSNMQNAIVYFSDSSYSKGASAANLDSLRLSILGYEKLLENSEKNVEQTRWSLQIAHANFLLGRFDKAYNHYSLVLNQRILNEEQRDLALFQKVNSKLRFVSAAFSKELLARPELSTAEVAGSRKTELEEIESDLNFYISNYPEKPRSLELIALTADLYLSLKHYSKALAFYLKIAETGKPSVYVDRGILGILVSMNDIAEPIEKAKLLSGIRKGAANHAKDTEKVKAKLLAAIDIYVEEASKKVSSSPESHRLASEVLTLVEQNEAIASMEKNSYAMIGVLYSGALWNEVVYWANVFSVKYQAGKSLNTLHRFKGVAHDRLLDYKQALTSYLEFLRKSRPNDDGFEKTYLRALELASLTQSTGALNELASLSINRISRESLTLTRFNLVMEKLHAVERWSDAQNFAKDFRMTQEELGAVVFADFWMAKILVSRGEEDEGIEKLKIIAQKIESNGLQDQGIELRDALAEAYLLVAKFSIEDFRAFTVPEDEGNKSEYISEKINLFSALSTQLEKCFELGSEKGSFEAQFIRAEMARELSELITSLLTRKESFADSKKDRLRSVAEGLMELSRSSHSKNALYVSRQNKFAKQNGSKVEENTWIRRSAVALGKTEKVDGKEELPVSVVAPMFLPF